MTIQRMDHVGIVVDNLPAATAFFPGAGARAAGRGAPRGDWVVDRVVGLEGVRTEIAMLQTPDGRARLELTTFHAPTDGPGPQVAPVVSAPSERTIERRRASTPQVPSSTSEKTACW